MPEGRAMPYWYVLIETGIALRLCHRITPHWYHCWVMTPHGVLYSAQQVSRSPMDPLRCSDATLFGMQRNRL